MSEILMLRRRLL